MGFFMTNSLTYMINYLSLKNSDSADDPIALLLQSRKIFQLDFCQQS